MRDSTSPKATLDLILQRCPPVDTKATRWGIEKEPVAKKAYQEYMCTRHNDFRLCDVGFVVDVKDNFLGASPDGIWTCSCHGLGTLEVKCPWELAFALCVRWHNQPSSDPANVLANKEPPVSSNSVPIFELVQQPTSLQTMRRGGSAGDAAVAMAAVLQVVSPIGSGVGGDCFGIFYDASTGTIRCLDGSGRSPAALTREHLMSAETDGFIKADSRGLLATVPGAVKAWFETVLHFGSGKLSMSEILEPAVRFAEEGFPLSLPGSFFWERAKPKLLRMHGGRAYLIDGETIPSPGDILCNLPMAGLLKRIADEGPSALYMGPVAQNIVEAVAEVGGLMTLDDLRKHLESSEPTVLPAISTTYRGTTVHTTPLPSQGAILLDALNILELFDLQSTKSNPAKYYHLVIEAMRLASEDGLLHVADPQFSNIDQLIRKEHGEKRKELLDVERFVPRCSKDLPNGKQGGTTFMAAVDPWGNACSFITSIAHPFGCTTVPEYGFGVHARGDGFNTMLGHPNCAAPCKKPFHSLMPVLVTDSSSGKLLSLVGTMGGSAQPQAILQ
ncbi:hypothetical protein HPB47_004471, partial [Ixodes persulcatus]